MYGVHVNLLSQHTANWTREAAAQWVVEPVRGLLATCHMKWAQDTQAPDHSLALRVKDTNCGDLEEGTARAPRLLHQIACLGSPSGEAHVLTSRPDREVARGHQRPGEALPQRA
jgi:hypothetical protein